MDTPTTKRVKGPRGIWKAKRRKDKVEGKVELDMNDGDKESDDRFRSCEGNDRSKNKDRLLR